MCGIAALFNLSGGNVYGDLLKMLRILSHRGPDGSGIGTTEGVIYFDLVEGPRSSLEGGVGVGANRLAIVGDGLQPIENEDGSLLMVFNGEVYNYPSLRLELASRGHRSRTTTDVEVALHLFEESGGFNGAVADYAAVILDRKREELWVFRDAMGVRPLFMARSGKLIAFASERKALRTLGDPVRVEPGSRIVVSYDGVHVEVRRELEPQRVRGEGEALRLLAKSLVDSALIRAHTDFAIFFSGGLDSSLLAKIYKDAGHEPVLITVGVEGSPDLRNAEGAAELLGMELEKVVLGPEEVLRAFLKMPAILDENDVLKALIGLPIFFAAERAKELGLKVAVTGQGADELFGGYAKYLRLADPAKEMLADLLEIHAKNLERDDHCTMAHGVEIRLPYLDERVVSLALGIPVSLKLRGGVRKYILRRVARSLGLPHEIVWREKKAVQYGSGVVSLLRRMARRKKRTLREMLLAGEM